MLTDRLRRWVLFDGSRLTVTAVGLIVAYLLLGPIGHILLSQVITPDHSIQGSIPLVTTFLSGDLLLVSIVVSVNSLYTSQEQTPLDQQAERIEAVGEFRNEFEELVDEPISPSEPVRFLQLLTGAILSEAQTLRNGGADNVDVDADVKEFVAEISEQTERVNSQLEDATTSLDLVLATLSYEYSRLANGLRRFRSQYGDDLTDAERERIERMLALLRHFATAREYFKTLYLSREFARLSKQLLYLSLPVILMASFVLLHSSIIPETHDITTVLIIFALSPFFLLAAFTVRVATVTIRTRAAGQFVVEE
ncbi:hypothetical protein [Halosegnis longus]|uniref:Uncharacterized protein n=1 Tax=Halosegnis longus TaxID=2216012 RepID=A0AAJ4R8E1_9EURY|nr:MULTISPECIES: hypothetical protein [Halobacteriales]RNJ26368.1 hypothetical protein Nmn1133_06610 [Salella cibi]